jgi:tetratricopeptide (TPR) repeat protein/SAM-dependent methyltransferase
MPDHIEQVFAKAVDCHQRGQLAQAEGLYRQVLAAVPHHPDSLNLLGVLGMQTGRAELAVELIGKAIALNAKIADFHNNIGEAFRRLGRLDQAIEHFAKAIDLEPAFIEAQQNLGDVLSAQGRLDEAAEIYSRILRLKPDFVAAHRGLSAVLRRQGRLDDAIEHLQQAVDFTPGSAQAHNDLGIALRERGRLDEAVTRFQRALSLKQDFPEAHSNLGNALRERGQLDVAAEHLGRALRLKPGFPAALHNLALVHLAAGRHEQALARILESLKSQEVKETKALFVRCLKEAPFLGAAADARPLLLRALSEPWGRPSELVGSVERQIKANPAVKQLIELAAGGGRDILQTPEFGILIVDELLKCLLTSAPVSDFPLERLLTRLRSALLGSMMEAHGQIWDALRLDFVSALARQCFINGYVFIDSEWERERVERLCSRLESFVREDAAVPVSSIVMVACYKPLHSLACADALAQTAWPDGVDAVVAQQIREPAVMRRLRATLPGIATIMDGVSLLVRRQYEENPYPSWVKAAPGDEWATIEAYVRNLFPLVHVDGAGGKDATILVAGCGTGQQSVETAQRFPHARVLAVDISAASLGYAMVRAAAVSNIEYAQVDILALGTIGRSFDLIEATGVLHHLADPMAGWRVLLSILRPGGFMRLGLYSKLARREVEAARAWIAQRGYRAVPDDIRRCRQEMMRLDAGARFATITRSPDFTSTSACRDLLFHVQEHQLTLPEIERLLVDEGLVFLGFELESGVLERYRNRFPQDIQMTQLDKWHLFETENPHTFGGMYQFWIQKPRR